MRLVTFSDNAAPRERFGALIENKVVDLHTVRDIMNDAPLDFPASIQDMLTRGAGGDSNVRRVVDYAGEHLENLSGHNAVYDEAQIAFLPPLPRPQKIICIGQNYMAHIREMGRTPPKYPLFFAKYANTLIGHRQPIILPRVSDKVDYEAELVCVIGQRAKFVRQPEALNFIAGYMNFNDVSVRDYQERTTQFLQGKTFDTTGPVGKAFVTFDEIPDPHNLAITSRLNGETMQQGSTSDFIFTLPHIIEYLTEIMTLEPGDMIATGTPHGVGAGRTPPVFLKPGDLIEVEVEGLGTLSNPVRADV